MKSIHIRIQREPYWDDAAITFAMVEEDKGVVGVVKPFEFTPRDPDTATDMMEPSVRVARREGDALLQSMMDQLWQLGIRPKDIGTAGHLAATQSHLADFRAIVAKTLDIKLP
jgi:hypothetical protein